MDTIKRKTTPVGIVTLIVGLAAGLGIAIWSVKSSQASNAPATKTQTTPTTERHDEWDPAREFERMQEEIDRAIRNATEQFRLAPNMNLLGPGSVTLPRSICATGKIISSSARICRT
jgi:hypothetical protein